MKNNDIIFILKDTKEGGNLKMGVLSFVISIVAAILSAFKVTRLPAFLIAIFGVIFGAVAGYQKDKEKSKLTRAFEIGAVIISGAVCVLYLVLLWF